MECSGELSGIVTIAPLYIWNGGNEFLFLFKQRKKTYKSFFRKLLLLVFLQMWSAHSYSLPLEACVCACVCVCVCVWRRERHREKAIWSLLHVGPFKRKSSDNSNIYICHLYNKGQREMIRQWKARLLQWEICRFAHWKRHTTETFHLLQSVVMRQQVFSVAAPYGYAVPSWCFEGTYRRHLQGCESVNWLINLKIKAAHFFETSGTNYPTRRRRNKQAVKT